MFGKKKRQHNDVTEVTKAGVAPTAELNDDKLTEVAGGLDWAPYPFTCPECGEVTYQNNSAPCSYCEHCRYEEAYGKVYKHGNKWTGGK